ncbi:hypothetical protein Ddye_004905 [Dipteronia dyeriana]|uniref:Gamma-glutamylcyclotransferase family protein n=1 Tax=Dipteronia dyeriana TaxID=168575 RepID=A0AAD9XFJ1_9ROSI|nr:hypothetical protein Ddye_004905 [Dipteronia dyeriana]
MGIEAETMIFTYGTLKRGFSNHTLLQDLIRTGDAVLKGTYTTFQKFPLVCGPYKVPFLLNMPGSGHRVSGELYAVSSYGLGRVDELEGTTRGHYQRLPIQLTAENQESVTAAAEAYFAETSYDEELWRKSKKMGFCCYSEKEAKGRHQRAKFNCRLKIGESN